jgi:hypothetical protein
MAIKTGEAALSTQFVMASLTGFYPWKQGYLDSTTNTIKATGTSSWSNFTAWSDFRNYIKTYKQIRWTSDLVDVGEIKAFTLKIETDYDGSLFFIIHVSDTGAFAGEEDQFIIENGNYAVPAFSGRYIYITAVVDGTELRKMDITANSNKNSRVYADIDTSTLTGSASSRTYSTPVPVSKIVDVQIQPKHPTAYAVDLYVSNTATSQVLIPMTISKSTSGITFALYGIDNVARDGVVDIIMTTMPRQAMIAGNLVVVE